MSGPCQSRTQQKGMATKRHRTHKDVSILFPSLMFLSFFVAVPFIDAWSQTPAGTVLGGVFSEVQAKRGQAAYSENCGGRHGGGPEGISTPETKGQHFLGRRRERMVDNTFTYIKE